MFLIGSGGRISCEVSGRRKHGKGLKIFCVHVHYYWSEENGNKDEEDAACEKWILYYTQI